MKKAQPPLGRPGLECRGDGTRGSAHDADVLCLEALGAAGDVELDLLPFLEGAEPLRLNRGVVAEDVVSALLRDETEPLGVVEPLHSTSCHCLALPLLLSRGPGLG